jgi:hypothetical protein
MKLLGDPNAITILKGLHKANEGFLKTLIDDCRSTTDHRTTFRDQDGHRYFMTLNPVTGELTLSEAPALSTRPPPPD